MDYVLQRGGRYYFNRRVPIEYRGVDKRNYVRTALKTDSRKEATRLAAIQNDCLEAYWKSVTQNDQQAPAASFQAAIKQARLLGFTYKTNMELAAASLGELHARLTKVDIASPQQVQAVMGTAEKPELKLKDTLQQYTDNSKGRLINKSPNQVRKWLGPRKLAMKNLVTSIGNKNLKELSRDDILKHRDWWIRRIEHQKVGAPTANKNIVLVKSIIETVNENLRVGLDIRHIFNKVTLPEENLTRRLPLESDFIRSVLLNPTNLAGLNEHARWVLHAMAETGAGVSEQVGLMKEDIILDCDIPHIIIRPRHKKALKTKYRNRSIPLVGYALDAFKACPNGFTDYHDRPDALSAVLSKYLRENNLLPSPDHTVYSLRHGFQDRLLAVNAPDRVQADLMGHKFNRPAYGDGATLTHKLEWLEKIQLKNINYL